MKRPTRNREELYNLYNKLQSQSAVARVLGISKQRVHQIVKDYKNTGIKRLRVKNRSILNCLCFVCKKSPAQNLHHKDFDNTNDSVENLMPVCDKCHRHIHVANRKGNGYVCQNCNRDIHNPRNFSIKHGVCATCWAIISGKGFENVKRLGKKIFYPLVCTGCGEKTSAGDREHGYHKACYRRTDEYREKNNTRQKLYFKRRYATDPEFRKYISESNKKHLNKKRLAIA